MGKRNVAIVREVYRTSESGELLQVIDHLNDQIEWTESPGTLPARTHLGMVAVLREVLIPFGPRWHVDPGELHDHGDKVVAVGRLSALRDTPAGGHFVHEWLLRDHRVVSVTASVEEAAAASAGDASPLHRRGRTGRVTGC